MKQADPILRQIALDMATKGYTTYQAEGAIPNGQLVRKCNSEPKDSHGNGSIGTVTGSLPIIEGMDIDLPGGPNQHTYFVQWPGDPVPTFIIGHKIQRTTYPASNLPRGKSE